MNDAEQQVLRRGDGPAITFIKGGLIGVANIIPGVSGGTFALILGIFDRLVGAINNIDLRFAGSVWGLVRGGFRRETRTRFYQEAARVDLLFLTVLMLGAAVTIGAASFLIDYLLAERPIPTLAFFIGLILPSIAVPWGMLEKKGARLLWILPGIGLTMGIALVAPSGSAGADNLAVAFGSGALAISAMILPGISGSYVLLVLGQYQNVLAKVTGLQRSIAAGAVDYGAGLWLLTLCLGMGVGILLFARLLTFLLKRYQSATMAFLIGLLVGSLWVLWPYKSIEAGAQVTDRSGEVKQEVRIATAPNRLPEGLQEGLLGAGAMAAGFVGAAGLIALGRRREDDPASDSVESEE